MDRSTLLQNAARVGVLFVSALYIMGLLIVNIDLSRHGLVKLDLGRPEYIMAGLLWAFLTASTLVLVRFSVREAKKRLSSQKWFWAAGWIFGEIIAVFGFVAFILGIFSHNQVVLLDYNKHGLITVNWRDLPVLLALLFNCLFIKQLVDRIAEMHKGGQFSLASPLAWELIIRNTISPVLFVLVGIILYAQAVFPRFPREFGGGQREIVRLFLFEHPTASWKELGLPMSGDSKTVGPVVLLLETETMLYLKNPDELDRPVLLSGGRSSTTVGIDKRSVSAVLMEPSLPSK